MVTKDEICRVKERYAAELLRKANVVGLAVGYKEQGGKKTDVPSLVVMVRKKVPASELGTEDVVPPEIESVTTDVEEVADISALVRTLERSGYRLRVV